MKQETHQEIYRVAFESANSELMGISGEFERLRARMTQIEKVVAALKPLVLEEEKEPTERIPEETTSEPTEAKAEAPAENEGEPAKMASDPFQRRVSHVLGIGAGIRDVRSYTRQF
jgi:hypothetical protein